MQLAHVRMFSADCSSDPHSIDGERSLCCSRRHVHLPRRLVIPSAQYRKRERGFLDLQTKRDRDSPKRIEKRLICQDEQRLVIDFFVEFQIDYQVGHRVRIDGVGFVVRPATKGVGRSVNGVYGFARHSTVECRCSFIGSAVGKS